MTLLSLFNPDCYISYNCQLSTQHLLDSMSGTIKVLNVIKITRLLSILKPLLKMSDKGSFLKEISLDILPDKNITFQAHEHFGQQKISQGKAKAYWYALCTCIFQCSSHITTRSLSKATDNIQMWDYLMHLLIVPRNSQPIESKGQRNLKIYFFLFNFGSFKGLLGGKVLQNHFRVVHRNSLAHHSPWHLNIR